MRKNKSSIAKDNGIVVIRLRQILEETGIKQNALARKMGVNEQHLSQILTSKKIIKVSDIEKILEVLKPLSITANDLFNKD